MVNYDWSQFTLTFYYPVSVEKLYEAWATAKGLESFFIESAHFRSGSVERPCDQKIQAGDLYDWKWRHDFSVSGTITEAVENHKLRFTFGSMNVSIDFKETEEGSILFMHQTDITEENRVMGHLNCRSCWVFFMTNLKSIYLTGKDLRDENPEIVSSMEVGFFPKELKE